MILVTSREYKILLKTEPFQNEECQKKFWIKVQEIANELEIEINGLMNEQVERKVRFFDTAERKLNKQGYVLRIRDSLRNGQPQKTKAMLKFRSPDRIISSGVDVSSSLKDSETKFEEDIVPPFGIQYAHSTSAEIKDSNWQNIADIAKVFPGITALGLNPTTPVEIVNGFVANERVIRGATLDFGKDEAPAAITLWYVKGENAGEKLAIAEFSFAYDHITGDFSPKSAKKAKNLFENLQTTGWYDPEGTTKTKFVYE